MAWRIERAEEEKILTRPKGEKNIKEEITRDHEQGRNKDAVEWLGVIVGNWSRTVVM